ncbi:hypothetical protein G3T36_02455 [Diaminobutyricibacter tongyongensis]|uniref:Uncharacterized protein n=1 Tax=Leifsonia tongyongensis TaxID=1268043 RepID=A0A6L9XTJ1_9MICO|nr:hypothetical protein [Diaminobutyricibacter tongyongensis]NEN04722.1 hypothetical protein [Diaminobutyricibacter tongyongensis]
MDGTLSIHGDLAVLSGLAEKINAWVADAVATEVEPDAWGGWTIDTMIVLLERLHPWQLLLTSFMARGNGQRSDNEVREKFAIGDSGLRGQTGPISKHILKMKAAGIIPGDASYLVRVDRTTQPAMFVTPADLVPIVQVALSRPAIERALDEARKSQGLDER